MEGFAVSPVADVINMHLVASGPQISLAVVPLQIISQIQMYTA